MAAKQNLRVNQSGLAAITVTLIILGIVTLITVGFATLMRREQRQALDQQLSTQAFYAAESGVNSARDYIDSTPADDLEGIDDCNDPNTPNAITSEKTLSSTVSFSCVLMDVTPENLEKSTSTDESWVTKVESENGAPIHRLEISWQTSDSSPFAESALADTHLLWPAGAGGWDTRTAVLRMMVMPDTADRNTIIRSTYQAMLYPNASNNPNDVATATAPNAIGNINNDALQAVFINGNCNTAKEPYSCKAALNLSARATSAFYLRLMPIYNDANMRVQAYAQNGTLLSLKNGQAEIDATGKAADVVRRIRVKVPLNSGSSVYPEYAVETFTTLCKRFITLPGESQPDVSTIASYDARRLTAEQEAACNIPTP